MNVGVIIPTYNRAALLVDALESVLSQDYAPREVVVVDDGSTDETAAAVTPFRGRGGAYIYQENAHLSAARNTGNAHLSPAVDAILFLDSDDRLRPGALRRLAAALGSAPDASLAYGRPCYIDEAGRRLRTTWAVEDFNGGDVWPYLVRRNFICTAGGVLLRRAHLARAGAWDTALRSAEDWDMWLRLAETGAPFVRVADPSDPVLEYRVHESAMSRDRETMRANEDVVYQKLMERNADNPARLALVRETVSLRAVRLRTAHAEGVVSDEAILSSQHRRLRRLIERIGIAAFYRRLPLALRLRMRDRFGVDRWA
jgi:glycosyltransferase involved in cell wall biosynthesis